MTAPRMGDREISLVNTIPAAADWEQDRPAAELRDTVRAKAVVAGPGNRAILRDTVGGAAEFVEGA